MRKILGRFERRPSMAESIGAPAPRPSSAVAAAAKGPLAMMSEDDTREVPVGLIEPDPKQPRKTFPPESIAGMAASLRARGQLEAVLVWEDREAGRYGLIFGERRWRGAVEAGFATIRAVVLDGRPSDREIRRLQFVENGQREDVDPLEEARAWDAYLTEHGVTPAEFAAETGFTQSRISKALALVRNLAPEVAALVGSGKLAPSKAYPISRLDPGDQPELARRAVRDDLSRDAVAAEVRARLGAPAGPVGEGPTVDPVAGFPGKAAGSATAPEAEAEAEATADAVREAPPVAPVASFPGKPGAGSAEEEAATRPGPPGGSPEAEPPPRPSREGVGARVEDGPIDRLWGVHDDLLGWLDPAVYATNVLCTLPGDDDSEDEIRVRCDPSPDRAAMFARIADRLRRAADSADQISLLARVPGGGARPGDRVAVDEPGSPAHACEGVILDDPGREGGIVIAWDGPFRPDRVWRDPERLRFVRREGLDRRSGLPGQTTFL